VTGRGYFVSIEGVDGAGKSTQVAALAAAVAVNGREVSVARPGDTALGELVRRFLSQQRTDIPIEPWSEALLFMSQRAQLLREVILPALDRGALVIADRYIDSTLAYQGGGGGLDPEVLRTLHRVVCHDIWPDMTILLDVPLDTASDRQRGQELPLDRFEQEPREFHERVAAVFDALAKSEPGRFVRVDATRPADELSREIRELVLSRISAQAGKSQQAASRGVPVA
jgi:dTMP kinase